MLRVTLAGLRAHTVRLVLTGLVVVLSVGFTAGTLVLTDSFGRAGAERVTGSVDGVDLAVESPDNPDTYLPSDMVDEVRDVDGVEAATARRESVVQAVDADGRVEPHSPARVVASSRDGDLAAATLTEGRSPSTSGEAILDTRTAERDGVAVGDTYSVAQDGEINEFTVVGLAEPSAMTGDAPELHVPYADVESLATDPGADRIDVRVSPDADTGAVSTAVGEVTGATVITGAELTDQLMDESSSMAAQMRIPLLMLGAVSWIVAAFVVANTFRILVAQRTRELALLRTIGATRRQVLSGVLLESTAVGVAGSLAGVALGAIAAAAISPLVHSGAEALPIAVTPSTVMWSAAVGIAVTVGSAILPARASTRVTPLQAIRAVPDGADTRRTGRRRLVAGIAATVAGSGALMAGALSGSDTGLVVVVFGASICFLGLLILGPRIVPPALRVLGGVAAAVAGRARATIRLATANSVRNPRRTAATSGALLIGVTMVAGFLTVAETARSSVDDVLNDQVPADFIVRAEEGNGVPDEAVAAIEEPTATGPVLATRQGQVSTSEFGDIDIAGVDPAAYGHFAGPGADESLDGVSDGEAVIDATTARDLGLSEGDTVTVDTADGPHPVPVGLVLNDDVPVEGMAVESDLFDTLVPAAPGPEMVAVDAADGVDGEAAREAVDEATARMSQISVTSNVDTRQELNDQLDQAVDVVLAILGLAVVIAVIGIANTMSLSVHERTREIGLLRALGLTRRQTRMMLSVEAVLVSVVAAILGAAVGVAFAWAAVTSLQELEFTVPWARIALCGVIAGVLGLVASIVPGRRAARTTPVVALAAE